jgi:HNH endonuclease
MKGYWITYTAKELNFIKRRSKMGRLELHKLFVRTFSREDVSVTNMNALCKRNGWFTGRTGRIEKGAVPVNKGKKMPYHPNSARTRFKKGNLPHNTNYLHHERVSKDGYVEISIDDQNPHTGFERRYVLKHRWAWEQKHGPVPEGMCLKCLGDQLNIDPSNWELIPRALLPRLNGRFGRGYDDAPNELKPTIMAVVKIEHQIREKTKRRSPEVASHQGKSPCKP